MTIENKDGPELPDPESKKSPIDSGVDPKGPNEQLGAVNSRLAELQAQRSKFLEDNIYRIGSDDKVDLDLDSYDQTIQDYGRTQNKLLKKMDKLHAPNNRLRRLGHFISRRR